MAGESFYNPGVSNQSGQILAQGISGAADSIGKGIEAIIARGKELKATRAMAIDGLGMDADTVNQMPLPKLQGIMAGEALKRSNVGQQLMQENTRLGNQLQTLQVQSAQRDAQSRTLLQKFMADPNFGLSGTGAGPSGDPNSVPDSVSSRMTPPGMQPGGPGLDGSGATSPAADALNQSTLDRMNTNVESSVPGASPASMMSDMNRDTLRRMMSGVQAPPSPAGMGPGPGVAALMGSGAGGPQPPSMPPPGFMPAKGSNLPPPGFLPSQSPDAGNDGPIAYLQKMLRAQTMAGRPSNEILETTKSIMDYNKATADRTPSFITDPQTGVRFVHTPGGAYGGGSTREEQSPQSSGPQPQYDEDGKILGYSIQSGNGKSVFKPTAAQPSGELQPATMGGKTVPGWGVDQKGNWHDLRASTSKPAEGVDPQTQMAIRTAQRTLVNLKAAKAAGTTRVKVDGMGNVKDAGVFGKFGAGDPVDDLIKAQRAKVDELQSDAGSSSEAPAASANGPTTPRSQADFDALPSGAQFVNPADGKVMIKK